ncbi:MAG: hypothetical protein KAR06_03040 [Deltaproteobacteria bacterium]|nr:hypothetical protein [Deltaproteobacteria bacterium]
MTNQKQNNTQSKSLRPFKEMGLAASSLICAARNPGRHAEPFAGRGVAAIFILVNVDN